MAVITYVPGPPKVPKIMGPILTILSILEYWAIILGTFGGPGKHRQDERLLHKGSFSGALYWGPNRKQRQQNSTVSLRGPRMPEVMVCRILVFLMHMGGCENYGPLWGPLTTWCRIIRRTQKRTIILTTTHILDTI